MLNCNKCQIYAHKDIRTKGERHRHSTQKICKISGECGESGGDKSGGENDEKKYNLVAVKLHNFTSENSREFT